MHRENRKSDVALAQVKLEQLRIYHGLSSATYGHSSFIAIVTAFVFKDLLSSQFLIIWIAAICTTNTVRYFFGSFLVDRSRSFSFELVSLFCCGGAFVSGCNWAVFALQFDASWPTFYQLFLILSLAGLIAGAIGSHASYFLALSCFYSPILVALMVISCIQSDKIYAWIALLVALFWVIVHVAGRRFDNMLRTNIQMQQRLSAANEKLELLARLDSLTKLQNRGALESYLSITWRQYRDYQRPVSIAMIDVDMFKAYNDYYGHVQGDRCLTHIASVLRSIVPEGLGFVGRYGGEEFIAVLPGHSRCEASNLMQKAQTALTDERIEHASSSVAEIITVSIGVESAVPLIEEDWMELVDRADAKLYIAKQQGRNQIV